MLMESRSIGVLHAANRWVALTVALLATVVAGVTAAEELSVSDAFKPPLFRSMRLSPDGKHIAAIGQVGGATALILIDAETLEAKHLDGSGPLSVPLAAYWVTHQLLAINSASGAALVTTSGKHVMHLGSRYLGKVAQKDGHDRVLIQQVRIGQTLVYLVDVQTGEERFVNWDLPEHRVGWVFDEDGIPRVVTTRNKAIDSDDTTITHWYRASADDRWQKLATFSITDDYWIPRHIGRDGRSLAIWSRSERDTWAIFRYDLVERRVAEMMAGHPTQDIAFVQQDEADEKYDSAHTLGMQPEIHWFDARWATLQRSVDAALSGRINYLSGNVEGKVLVQSYGDVDPGRWFVLDTTKLVLKQIAVAKPEIDVAKMQPMQIVSYPSGELTIPAYLTLPHAGNKLLPTVVLIHGGPIARDRWQWNREVQLLASRGYAVFQPQFRGSDGFGKHFARAGYGQWGLAMQDDVTNGVRWLIDQGIADPQRICVYGASYGGYAAMWALAKTPDLFRCGVTLAGVSDIEFMMNDDSDVNRSATGRVLMRARIGDLKTQRQQFDDVSPMKNAALIKAPLLIAHGTKDVRVPIEHSEKMVAALKKNNKPYEWIKLPGEGHGIAKPENQKRFYDALFKFLDAHIGANAGRPRESSAVRQTVQ